MTYNESGQKPARDYLSIAFLMYAVAGTIITVSSAQKTQCDKSVTSNDE